jgi:predicted deacylase
VSKGDVIGRIAAPLMHLEHSVVAPADGILIGRTHLPLVYEGEALFHIARFHRVADAAEQVEALQRFLEPEQHEAEQSIDDETD